MIIYMTEEQAKKLGDHLRAVKKRMEKDRGDIDIPWSELALQLEMDDYLLGQLAKGKRKDMTAETLAKLVLGFGPEVLTALGINPNIKPLFGPKDGTGQGA